ncbi:MAG: hypothetical protein OEZ23_02985, partial [Gammaproteobacteria bacterium]|nr:hypothetical protein [Gammaproteobacteria bacterium]
TYTAVGGIWAVVLTDMVQVIIIALGLIILLIVVVVDMGGWSAIVAQLPENSFRMVPLEHTAENWLRYLRLWLIFGLADLCSQTLMQRVFAAKSEQVAQNAFYFAGTGYLLLGLVPVALGMIAAISLPGLEDPETAIPMLALEHLHPVAIAVLVGALLAAIMSSADSSLLAAASIVGVNLAPYFKRDMSEKQKLRVTQVAIFACGIFAVYVALKVQVVLELIFDANSIMLVAIIMPFIAGVWWKKTNRYGAYSAMVAGCVTFLVAGWLYPSLEGDVIGFAASLITLLVVSALTQKQDPPRQLLDSTGQPISLENRFGTLPIFGSGSGK